MGKHLEYKYVFLVKVLASKLVDQFESQTMSYYV